MNIFSHLRRPEPTLDPRMAPAMNAFLRGGRPGELKVVDATTVYYRHRKTSARFFLRDGHIFGWLLEGRRLASLQWRGDYWQSQSRMVNLDDRLYYEERIEGRY